MKRTIGYIICVLLLFSCGKKDNCIIKQVSHSPRIAYGASKISDALSQYGYLVKMDNSDNKTNTTILIGEIGDTVFKKLCSIKKVEIDSISGKKEAFTLKSVGDTIIVAGSDASGALYGCLEIADMINKNKCIPKTFQKTDKPEMVLRGACIGLQKTEYLPGRDVYEYPYTPENFPWFYDKALWIKYLDMLAQNRMNSLYLWNGHPFASLVKLKDYPYAVEVSDSVFKLNEEMYSFITQEADKRGIWVIQMFYNIIVSKPFAEHNGIKTQDRSRPITPLISDYTKKSITAFIKKYPNVGLMVCLGEAMNTIDDDVQWFTQTIIPGVKDGLDQLGSSTEPPLILRGHDTDPIRVMKAAIPLYSNLYTMQKYNGESLTTYEPRGSWADIPMSMSKLGTVHIANVHILANLEPFRYGSPDFIQKSVKAMHTIQGANALHLYPQASYWDWPYTADKTNPRLLEMDRDRIWYKAWGRYAWNCHRGKNEEITYWTGQLENMYGCPGHGEDILKAYDESGEIAPKLLRRFGISDGNRQTLLLGMFMSQLVNPYKWRIYSSFYNSNGPEGEILVDWAKKEWNDEQHTGETPPQIVKELLQHSEKAKEAILKAEPYVKNNKEEFERLKNDMLCYDAFTRSFTDKVKAAMLVLRYKYSNDVGDLEKALPLLEQSVKAYTELVDLTKNTYLYANSMQTSQRRIPIDGTDGENKTWEELLPHYQKELDNFKNNLERIKNSGGKIIEEKTKLNPLAVNLLDEKYQFYDLKKGAVIYSDKDYRIQDIAPELSGLKGIKLSYDEQINEGTSIHFSTDKPVKIVVGYFNGHSFKILNPPTLETDASANNRGQADIRIANAMVIDGLYPINIYTYKYEPGEYTLNLGKGICLVLGFMDGSHDIKTYDAGIGVEDGAAVDWLFY